MTPVALTPEIAQAIAAALATNKTKEMFDATKVPAILLDNYFQMRRMNNLLLNNGLPTAGTDDYYHEKAHKEVAELGALPTAFGQTLGYIKESLDLPRNLFLRGTPGHVAAQDFKHDLTINVKGAKNKHKDISDDMSDGMKKLYKALKYED